MFVNLDSEYLQCTRCGWVTQRSKLSICQGKEKLPDAWLAIGMFVEWKNNFGIACFVRKRWRGKESVLNLFLFVDVFDSKVLNAICVNLNACYLASVEIILGCWSFVTKYLGRDCLLLFPSINNGLKKYLRIVYFEYVCCKLFLRLFQLSALCAKENSSTLAFKKRTFCEVKN